MARKKEIQTLFQNFPVNIGHRGARGLAPENTIVSFLVGSESTRFFELDTMLCKSGEPVVIHDFTVDRTTDGTGAVSTFTLKELQSLDAGQFFGEEFEGEVIPSLEEVIESLPEDTVFDIELKSEKDEIAQKKLSSAVLKLIQKLKLTERCFVTSFDWDLIQIFQKENPNILRGLLLEKNEALPKNIRDYEPDLFLPHYSSVTENFMKEIARYDLGVIPYTVNEPKDWDNCLKLGVLGLITDFPDRLADYLESK